MKIHPFSGYERSSGAASGQPVYLVEDKRGRQHTLSSSQLNRLQNDDRDPKKKEGLLTRLLTNFFEMGWKILGLPDLPN
jgi:hypothetical protein